MKAARKALAASALMCALTGMAGIEWLSSDYDFGTWHEVQGRRTGRVEFVNTGPDTVMITSVRPSCGCTAADYYRDAVAPGDTAWVSFTYDPSGRPGRFDKTVKVYTDPGRELKVIHIRGTIVGTPQTLMNDYPEADGSIRLSASRYAFSATAKGEARHAFITGYNQGSDTIYPRVSTPAKPLEATVARRGVAPGEAFTVAFYLPTRTLDSGPHSWPLTVSAGTSSLPVEVSIDVLPAATSLSEEEMTRAPRIEVPTAPVELTGGKPGGKLRFRFNIGNGGLDPLHVERIYSRAGAVTITRVPRSIKQGKEGRVEGVIDLSRVEGPAFGYIVEIITDDPRQPVATVRVTGQNPH